MKNLPTNVAELLDAVVADKDRFLTHTYQFSPEELRAFVDVVVEAWSDGLISADLDGVYAGYGLIRTTKRGMARVDSTS